MQILKLIVIAVFSVTLILIYDLMTAIVGRCMSMCPEKEFRFRKQHHLMHLLELPDESAEGYASLSIKSCVKEFRRSAAGESISDVECLRPSLVLRHTVEYLFKTVMNRICPFSLKYDFIFDRLRSVRQDAVIQRLETTDPNTQLVILQRCVKFYLYAVFEVKKNPQLKIDLHINKTHLSDCLRALFKLYCTDFALFIKNEAFHCTDMTASYTLLNFCTPEVLHTVLKYYPKLLRTNSPLNDAIILYFSFHNHNYIRFNKIVNKLIDAKSYTLLFALSTFLDEIRNDVIKMLCISHSSKVGSFNASGLRSWLLLSCENDALSYCEKLGLIVSGDAMSVKFSKSNLPMPNTAFRPSSCLVSKELSTLQKDRLSDYLLE